MQSSIVVHRVIVSVHVVAPCRICMSRIEKCSSSKSLNEKGMELMLLLLVEEQVLLIGKSGQIGVDSG